MINFNPNPCVDKPKDIKCNCTDEKADLKNTIQILKIVQNCWADQVPNDGEKISDADAIKQSIRCLEEYLESLAENTPENPYVVNVTGLTQEHFHTESSASNVAGSYLSQIIQNSSKYVTLKEKETSYNNAKIEDFSFAANSYLTGIMGYVSMGYSIGQYAFMGCTSLTSIEIPDSVTSIGFVTFGLCASLISITIPVSVTSIDSGAFVGCSSLTITSNNTKYVTCSNGHGLIDTSTKTLIWSNENIIPNDGSVNSIDSYALSYCPSLTNITIPDSITSIGGWVFEGCTSLTSINISDSVTEIGDYAFSGCSSLTSVKIPLGVTTIGKYAFWQDKKLTTVKIPSSVTYINSYAFRGCENLEVIIDNTEGAVSISSGALDDCKSVVYLKIVNH